MTPRWKIMLCSAFFLSSLLTVSQLPILSSRAGIVSCDKPSPLAGSLLYLSVHPILEYDEVLMFQDLGYCVFSTSMVVAYADRFRPFSERTSARRCLAQENYYRSLPRQQFVAELPIHLTKELVDKFDVIVIMHDVRYLELYWHILRGKMVILRTIGQSWNLERRIARFLPWVYVVRYSPNEHYDPNYAGADAVIRFAKKPTDFLPWVGDNKRVVTFNLNFKERFPAAYDLFMKATKNLQTEAYITSDVGQVLSWDDQLRIYSKARVYFAAGSLPAPYTLNFMEAWMSGTPIIAAPSQIYGTYRAAYEVPALVQEGVTGFVARDAEDFKLKAELLLSDESLARRISENGRKRAIELFGIERISQEWAAFLRLRSAPKGNWIAQEYYDGNPSLFQDAADPPLASLEDEMLAIDKLLQPRPTRSCTIRWYGTAACTAANFVDGCWPACDELIPPDYCLVYSFGINNDWTFDDAISGSDSACVVLAFDPSMNNTPAHVRGEKVFFFPEGLSGASAVTQAGWRLSSLETFMARFGHRSLDYLKVDVEGAEWSALENFLDSGVLRNVAQLGIEIHLWAQEANITGAINFEHEIASRAQQVSILQARAFRRALRRLLSSGFRLQWIHTNPLGLVTNANRRCCFEMLLVNERMLRRTTYHAPKSGPALSH